MAINITGSDKENNFSLSASSSSFNVNALGGNDTVVTGSGNDIIHGGSGNDTIDGGAGIDLLDGGAGNDVLTGGAGTDYFGFQLDSQSLAAGYDRITDFNPDEDYIQIFNNNKNVDGMDDLGFSMIGDDTYVWLGASNDPTVLGRVCNSGECSH